MTSTAWTKRGKKQGPGALRELYHIFRDGDWSTRLSFFVMGFGCIRRGQLVKGLLYLAMQALIVWYLIAFAWQYVQKLGTLGTTGMQQVGGEGRQLLVPPPCDNSLLILLFSVMSILLVLGFVAMWRASVRSAWRAQQLEAAGRPLPTFPDDIRALLNERFHATLLTMPGLMVLAFTILPTLLMILLAFTSFGARHQPPGDLFTWVGLQNFRDLFGGHPRIANTFSRVLGWTLIWAVIATLLNYILGMVVALFIHNKGVRLKAMWRALFVLTIAVPQFISILLMRQILHELGPLNALLKQLGFIEQSIPFLTDTTWARIMALTVNLWVGIPYAMLITSGILRTIPRDLYDSASIDGAGPARMLLSITLPNMLLVTAPYLITALVGNINSFNVIFLLTRGGPLVAEYHQAGKTDLLVTWLYRLTVGQRDYALASTIGILVFIISAGLSLLALSLSGSVRREEAMR